MIIRYMYAINNHRGEKIRYKRNITIFAMLTNAKIADMYSTIKCSNNRIFK